jgi:hypothetical protein
MHSEDGFQAYFSLIPRRERWEMRSLLLSNDALWDLGFC